MGLFTVENPLVLTFGLLGNIISLMVYLAPIPTFYRIYKKKTTEGFQSLPYVVALFSSMLWIYYAFLKSDATFLITINSVGCVIETIYLAMYMAYAARKARVQTTKFLLSLNVGVFCLILLLTLLLVRGPNRVVVLGWVCVGFSVCVFAAPLGIMRKVIKTKSVEFMPFYLSLFLTLSAVAWFSYGLLLKDMYIALPNILGFIFGMGQMILYVIYKGAKPQKIVENEANSVVEVTSVDTHATLIDVINLKEILSDGQIIIVNHNNIEDVHEQLAKEKNIGGAILYQHQNVIEI
ncbi:bidirectional sugar transporter SWEET14-like [Papaver somniferum]|uniref:bidirectional sugar transporter SWEET14-like n=1 Tax=Papaver somniferum TaxID=3469 RepID=UPI000E6FB8E7|nr:bidirectional sugar transporter SWEET14-like [Papaver somniferum]